VSEQIIAVPIVSSSRDPTSPAPRSAAQMADKLFRSLDYRYGALGADVDAAHGVIPQSLGHVCHPHLPIAAVVSLEHVRASE
jgi:hypothetical protein